MSIEYPCVYLVDGMCKKLSDDKVKSWCAESHCGDQMPSNAGKIRSMTDDKLNELFHEIYNAGVEDAVAYEWGQRTNSFEWTMKWLQQPAKRDNYA